MFKPHFFEGRSIGFSAQWGNAFFFFGNRNFTRQDFHRAFPAFAFRLLKQVHGNTVVRSRPEAKDKREEIEARETADAHFTEEKNVALLIQTADCLPLLFASAELVAACHAGWRGVANGIIGRTARKIPNCDRIAVGPHIQVASFECGRDVADQLLSTVPQDIATKASQSHPDPRKSYVDLALLAQAQLGQEILAPTRIEPLGIDTMADLNFHSFRRDHARAERQYSFVARTS